MYKNQKRVVASFALVAGIASSVSAVNAFANKMVKAMAYRHHKEDDKPSILETATSAASAACATATGEASSST